jgi:ATP-dependent DNA helicase 2 subunit 1
VGLGPMKFKSSGADGISLLTNLISDINSKQVAKRSVFSNLPFEIGPGFKISINGYNVIQKQKPARSTWIYLNDEKAQIVKAETTKFEEGAGREVKKEEIKRAYKFGGAEVYFTPEEQKELKNFGPPVLRIIGFKPQSLLPDWASMNKSTYIYPSENDYIGSTRVFAALWQKLLKDKKMGVAWFISRKGASPLLVAILPSAERVDENTGGQVIPQGLWLYPLPYADDVRQLPDLPDPVRAPDKLITEMRRVLQQLQLPKAVYDPSKYPNPSLQWHYKILQAIALEEDMPDTPEDKTVPKYKQIQYVHLINT